MRWLTCSLLARFRKDISLLAVRNNISLRASFSQRSLLSEESPAPDIPSITFCPSWQENCIKNGFVNGMVVVDDFITAEEESNIMAEVDPYMKKMRYEYDHWDNAIHGFRETERQAWNEKNTAIINRVKATAFKTDSTLLEHVHVLDLAPNGFIKPHVDSVRFCGSVIAGICLLSDAVMRLIHTEQKQLSADVLLKRRCLYMIRDLARYDFTHEILPQESSVFKNEKITRGRRISIICRSVPEKDRQNSSEDETKTRDLARYDFTHEILPQESSVFKNEKITRGRRISIICRSVPEKDRQNSSEDETKTRY